MLNAVTEFVAGPKSPEQLEAKRAETLQAIEAARGKYREACLDAEDGEDATGRRKLAAAKEVERLEARERDLAAAIVAARARAEQRSRKDAASESERRWALALEHAEARLKAAADAEKAMALLHDAFIRLAQSSVDMDKACPVRLGSDGALTMPPDLQNLLRLGMVKAGFNWAATWPWGPHGLPTLVSRIETANKFVEHLRREAQQA